MNFKNLARKFCKKIKNNDRKLFVIGELTNTVVTNAPKNTGKDEQTYNVCVVKEYNEDEYEKEKSRYRVIDNMLMEKLIEEILGSKDLNKLGDGGVLKFLNYLFELKYIVSIKNDCKFKFPKHNINTHPEIFDFDNSSGEVMEICGEGITEKKLYPNILVLLTAKGIDLADVTWVDRFWKSMVTLSVVAALISGLILYIIPKLQSFLKNIF